jgi:hypothetical protein
MVGNEKQLGARQSIHGVAPAFLQRAAIVAIVSFVFFLLMLAAFSLRQNIGYFLLATAFLIVQLVTLFGWITQKRAELTIYENGFVYKKHVCQWDEIQSLEIKQEHRLLGGDKIGCRIEKMGGGKILLTETIANLESILLRIDAEIAKRS